MLRQARVKEMNMQLVINTYGSYLHKEGNSFRVKRKEDHIDVSASKVQSILITTGATISTDAIKHAIFNNIDIVFLDDFGEPYARIWHPRLGSTALIRRRQLELSLTDTGLDMAKEWSVTKLENQAEFLAELGRHREAKCEIIVHCIEQLRSLVHKLKALTGNLDDKRNTIMGYEGIASRHYFETLSALMPERFRFPGRSRNPAKDEFNALLNYAYGILYSRVERACILAGLDPYIGFLHTDNYNKISLVFDLIEMFRILADKTVFYLFSQRKVKECQFRKIHGGLALDKEGKALLIAAINETFDKTVRYRGRKIKNGDTIQFECHRIANQLLKAGDSAEVESALDSAGLSVPPEQSD